MFSDRVNFGCQWIGRVGRELETLTLTALSTMLIII